MRGSLFSSVGMVGSVYIMVSGGKCMMTCVSSNIVLYGASYVVHSLSGMVWIVIVSWFSFAARWAQCMAFCIFFIVWVGISIFGPFMFKGGSSRSKY
jgi:hypothetical protein